jgi:hypothetical protein
VHPWQTPVDDACRSNPAPSRRISATSRACIAGHMRVLPQRAYHSGGGSATTKALFVVETEWVGVDGCGGVALSAARSGRLCSMRYKRPLSMRCCAASIRRGTTDMRLAGQATGASLRQYQNSNYAWRYSATIHTHFLLPSIPSAYTAGVSRVWYIFPSLTTDVVPRV